MLQIIEVKPRTYKVPSIDNRNRKGYAMYSLVAGKLGTPLTAELTTLSGDKVEVRFSATGWTLDCKHPATRIYSWLVGETLCAGCCVCGAVLSGGVS
ncbi:MAG: hypothetical protein EHM40_02860 [Chloroflexi bacterium]|nr:MAG: hypothetical protein EHM40_02860 [Chloroflexota bacterium]